MYVTMNASYTNILCSVPQYMYVRYLVVKKIGFDFEHSIL